MRPRMAVRSPNYRVVRMTLRTDGIGSVACGTVVAPCKDMIGAYQRVHESYGTGCIPVMDTEAIEVQSAS